MIMVKKYRIIGRGNTIEFINRELDEEQRDAVFNSKGYALVIAGPGSGKTRTITYKIAQLVHSGVNPSEILLMTFTRAAAREMIERAKSVVSSDLNGMLAGTFHHVCNVLLRRYARRIGYDENFTILDQEDSKELINYVRNSVISSTGVEKRRVPLSSVLRTIFSYSMNTLTDLRDAVSMISPKFMGEYEIIEKIFEGYVQEKLNQGVMDYDDLLVNTYNLLRTNEDIRMKEASRYRWVLVDEFQDTNILQFEIAKMLSSVHGNLFVVGDDAQSIYSFRGARYENVMEFSNMKNCRIFKLQTNYRSTIEIVNLINEMIPRKSFKKELKAHRGRGEKPVLVKSWDRIEEANFVAQRIEELMEDGIPPSEIAVLYRVHSHSMDLQMELMRRRINFKIFSGLKFTELAHIKDIMAFLKVIQNPSDKLSWLRILKLFPGIGKSYSGRIADEITDGIARGMDPVNVMRKIGMLGKVNLDDIANLFDELFTLSDPAELIKLIRDLFYDEYMMLRYPDYRDRQLDLERLTEMADRYSKLGDFISDMMLSEKVDVERDLNSSDSIVLTTVHQAKGLEWKVVFVLSVNPGDFPHYMALKEGNLDEEERIFYVAITRAKDILYISTQRLGNPVPFRSNRIVMRNDEVNFISRIPEDLVDEWEIE